MPAKKPSLGDGLASVTEQLVNRVLKPLGLVVISRERIRETLEEAAEARTPDPQRCQRAGARAHPPRAAADRRAARAGRRRADRFGALRAAPGPVRSRLGHGGRRVSGWPSPSAEERPYVRGSLSSWMSWMRSGRTAQNPPAAGPGARALSRLAGLRRRRRGAARRICRVRLRRDPWRSRPRSRGEGQARLCPGEGGGDRRALGRSPRLPGLTIRALPGRCCPTSASSRSSRRRSTTRSGGLVTSKASRSSRSSPPRRPGGIATSSSTRSAPTSAGG